MRRVVLLTLAAVTAACGGAPDPAGSVPASDGAVDQVADVLVVSCADGTLSLGAERVDVQVDGLHVEVEALPDRGTSVQLASPDETQPLAVDSGGATGDTGLTVMDTVAPGTLLVRCYPEDGPRHMLPITEDEEATTVEIVDHDGHWAEPERLDCEGAVAQMHPDYASRPAPPAEPVEPLAGGVDTGGRDAVEIRTYGYPEGTTRWASIIDDGDVVSRGTYVRDGTSWRLVGSTGCG